eukprot:150484-Pelagomonas_calceolata.AAC.1
MDALSSLEGSHARWIGLLWWPLLLLAHYSLLKHYLTSPCKVLRSFTPPEAKQLDFRDEIASVPADTCQVMSYFIDDQCQHFGYVIAIAVIIHMFIIQFMKMKSEPDTYHDSQTPVLGLPDKSIPTTPQPINCLATSTYKVGDTNGSCSVACSNEQVHSTTPQPIGWSASSTCKVQDPNRRRSATCSNEQAHRFYQQTVAV